MLMQKESILRCLHVCSEMYFNESANSLSVVIVCLQMLNIVMAEVLVRLSEH